MCRLLCSKTYSFSTLFPFSSPFHLGSIKITLKAKCGDMLIIPALRRLKQENCEFEASLGYKARPCPSHSSKNPK
jgi:hypothetical protein